MSALSREAQGQVQASSADTAALPVSVGTAGDNDALAWSAYVEGKADATIYHTWNWRNLLAQAFSHRPHYLIARRGDSVVGVLPLVQVKTLVFGHSLSSLPFCPYAGPLADDAVVARALDTAAEGLARELGVDHLEYRVLPSEGSSSHEFLRPDWPTQDLYVAFRKPLLPDHDANLNAIPRKQRAMVRKGIKAGLTAERGDLDTFFALFADNVHRHGTPAHSRRYFALLLEAFGDNADILIVRAPGGEAVSGVLSLYFRGEVLPMHAGDLASARDLAANDFKYWSLMRHAVERGCTLFDYGRSKRGTGPFDFKKNWGFEPVPLRYEYRLIRGKAVPQNNPLNPKYRLMIETWRKMPRWFVNAAGPLIVRGLG
jgi:FemAB-related protein (PEP-CTERM system-associated)